RLKTHFMNNISIIVAIAENFAIGKDNDLLFHLPDDLKRFKRITLGHPVIMGRNTLLSLPRWPLPGRRNIVITDNLEDDFPGCETVFSVEQAMAKVAGEEEAFVIGGGSIYRQFFPLARKLYLTLVHQPFDADTWFPEINYSDWRETSREDHFDETNGFAYSYLNLEKKEQSELP
ncbi:MAG TPA: dihydrofolate reductase, partial [Prolixibacteraceae bacterium]|nr:dihydrofolate reductase [Prolixibacteraceae bacterium]